MKVEPSFRSMFLLVLLGVAAFVLSRALLFRLSCKAVKSPELIQVHDDEYFIPNQVIVTGPRDEVSAAVVPLKLDLIEDCDLSYLNTRTARNPERAQGQRNLVQALLQPPVMRLYEIPAGRNAKDVATAIEGANIRADPNYFISLSDSETDPCGRPNSGGGTGGGTPFGGPYIPDSTTGEAKLAEQVFMKQWAFGPRGINLDPSSRFAGGEVRIGVFDTSTFRNTHGSVQRIAIAQPSPLRLTTFDTPGTENIMQNPGQIDDRNHGLFVAGLIHAVAPKSKIQLIRVLNDDGCGQLWVLNKALEDFTSRMSAWSGDLDETVINLSLGIHMPDMAQPDDLQTLEAAITDADRLGAIVVSAAGNDSPLRDSKGNIIADPVPMQVPADYPNVIGVASTNKEGKRSCYSNVGDVAAPGGDGGVDPQDPSKLCEARAGTWNQSPGPNAGAVCTDPANCPYILISLAQTNNGPQYIYWSGTSFATPLVSGLAALAYEEGEKSQVLCLIEKGVSPPQPGVQGLGMGTIDISDTFSSATMQQCP